MNNDLYIECIDLFIGECEELLQALKNVKSDEFENSYFRMCFCSVCSKRIFEFCERYILEFDKEKENEKN